MFVLCALLFWSYICILSLGYARLANLVTRFSTLCSELDQGRANVQLFASVPLPYNAKKLQSNLAKLLGWILSLHLDGLVVTNNEDAHAASRQNNAYHFTFTVYVPSTPLSE